MPCSRDDGFECLRDHVHSCMETELSYWLTGSTWVYGITVRCVNMRNPCRFIIRNYSLVPGCPTRLFAQCHVPQAGPQRLDVRHMSTHPPSDEEHFFITTPVFYVNASPHLGHLYSAVTADCLHRYKLLQGFKSKFSTGNSQNMHGFDTMLPDHTIHDISVLLAVNVVSGLQCV